MSQSKFVKNLAILIILNLLIKPFWILGIDPAVQAKVGDTAYGEYSALFNFSFLLNILLDFGITNFNNKNIAQNNHLITKHFSGLFVLKLALAFIYIIATLAIGFFIGYESRYMKLLLILGFNQFLISMILYLRSNLLGLHLFKTDSIVSVLDRFIMIIFCGMLLWTNVTGIQLDIMNFVYTQTLSYIVTAIIAFVMVMRKTTSFALTWNWPFSLMILKKSFPFAVLVLLMTFYNRLDTVMIERLLPTNNIYIEKVIDAVKHNPELYAKESIHRLIDAEELKQSFTGAGQAGIYTKGFRLLDAANMIAFLFAMQLLPTFSRMIKYKESVEQLVKLSFTLLMTPALIIAISCFFYSEHLTALINHGNTNSAPVFGILMCCFAAISTTYIFGTLLTANGNLRQLNVMALTGICINLVLNLVLIPKFMAYGSAISSLITQFFTAIVQVILAARIFHFRFNRRLITQLFLFIAGIIGFNIFTCRLSFFWMINFALMCGLSGIWAFVIGLVNVKSLFRFLKYS